LIHCCWIEEKSTPAGCKSNGRSLRALEIEFRS
jgi:hypothetical protein